MIQGISDFFVLFNTVGCVVDSTVATGQYCLASQYAEVVATGTSMAALFAQSQNCTACMQAEGTQIF